VRARPACDAPGGHPETSGDTPATFLLAAGRDTRRRRSTRTQLSRTPLSARPTPRLPGAQEAGYFNIDATTDKNYFYWFFESRGSPSSDPLVLWLTGGVSVQRCSARE
jgi:carboxypeptidase C (cathepsin A)